MKTTGNTVLITGGAAGIGLALSDVFLANGNDVIAVGRSAERLKEAATSRPGLKTYRADVGEPAAAALLAKEFPDVNILINNAGIQYNYSFLDEPDEAKIEHELQVNLHGPLRLTRAFLPGLRKQAGERGAAVVNVSSGLAISPKATAPVYCASKAALHSFSVALRYQLEPAGVEIFELMAPLVDTDMTRGRGKDKLSPEELARSFWKDFRRGRAEMLPGKTRLLYYVNRVAPGLARRIMRKM